MSINTKVEQIAYGHATALVLSELGQQENYARLMSICLSV